MTETEMGDVALEARRLLRAARSATLATARDGQPFASLVTPATAQDGSILLLLSDLSEHTRHLRANGRCAVMVCGPPADRNPQTAPRLTVTGVAAIDEDPALRARWVSAHPYAAFYADFGDFNLWRLRPGGGLLVGGFARANRLQQAELEVAPSVAAALAEAEPGVIGHCNADHADALAVIAAASGHADEGWRMTACDADGFDLMLDENVIRIGWPQPVSNAGDIRTALVHLARAARKAAITSAGPG